MAMISVFSKLVLLFITAHVTSALNSPVPFVHTVSNVTLISGKEALLTCKYNRTIFAVYWRYESTASAMELLVVLDKHYEDGKRSGPGYEKGRVNITGDYSLIIHDVQATDEGKYICEVSDYETGSVLRNHTDVTTIAIAERPFVRIEQCEDEVYASEIDEPCVLHTTSEDLTVQLTCTVVGAKPVVDLTWEASMSSEQWKQVMNTSTLITRDRGNGVFDQTLTVILDTSYIKSNKQHFTCISKGLAVDGVANRTIAVYYPKDSNVSWTVVAVVISVVCTLLFTLVIIGVWLKVRNKDDKGPSQKATLKKKIKEIKNMKGDEPVYLGVIGDKGAGKTSFIESLIFLIQGTDESKTQKSEGKDADNSSEIWKCTEFISKGLRIRKMRDEKTIEPNEISTILTSRGEDNPSSSQGFIIESDELIHYPILIFDVRNKNDRDNRIKLLNELSDAICTHIGLYPMLLLTKATATTYKKEVKELIEKIVIPPENILATFHYLDPEVKFDDHKEELLDFILKCVAKVDMQKRIRKDLKIRWKRKVGYKQVQSDDTAKGISP